MLEHVHAPQRLVQGFYPLNTLERRLKCRNAIAQRRILAHSARRFDDQRFDDLHHVVVVRVCLVKLQHRKLRIVRPVDPFVSKVVTYLVHSLEAADDETLQIQLVGDPQKERHVERPMVCLEWSRGRAPI